MSKLFVDTAGWANLFIPTETYHVKASQLFRQSYGNNQLIVTTNYIIAELVALLDSRRRAARSQNLSYVENIKTSRQVTLIHIDPQTDDSAWELCKSRLDKTWSLVDCTSFIIMDRFNIQQALTTDRHFEQAGFTRLLKPET